MSPALPPRPSGLPDDGLFVTGTDTEVGKTYVASRVIAAAATAGFSTGAYKPAASGAEFDPDRRKFWGDVRELSAACGSDPSPDVVCPQRFNAALAPPEAARAEDRAVDAGRLVTGAAGWAGQCDRLVVEGAGGLLSPLADGVTNADVAAAFGYPLLVIAADRLGAINHTLLTLEAASTRGLRVSAVVFSRPAETGDASTATNANAVRAFRPGLTVLTLGHGMSSPRDQRGAPVAWETLWRDAP
ncbi:MAG: dethiobiotin synthase [Planctomycetota bacterium]